MNKKFLTIAVSAALIGPATVLADVTVYGQLHMSLDYTDTNTDLATANAPTERKSNLSVSNNSSRIGFKGDENLGGGLKGIWQIESSIGMDEGQGSNFDNTNAVTGDPKSSGIGSRNTFLGVAGNFGTFLVGKHDTPLKMLGRSLDPFVDTIADTRQLLAADYRPSNVIAYITPDFNGFNAVVAYVAGLSPNSAGADNNKMDAFSLNATYKNGPIYAGAAYETYSKEFAAGLGNPTTGLSSAAVWRVGGSYAFGPVTVGGMFEQLKDYDFVDLKQSNGTLFGTYTFGAETIKLAYTMAGKPEIGGTEVPDSSASLLAIGLDHNFSKRTKAYVQYTGLTNEDNATYNLGAGGGYGDTITSATGKDPSAFSVGLIHKF